MVLLSNKRITRDYEFLIRYEAGMELLGTEVKSLRNKLGSLAGSYCLVRGAEVFLINAHIPPYQEKNVSPSYNPNRNRKLLLTRKEINKLTGYDMKKGLTLLPLEIYTTKRRLRIKIAVARKKKLYDKRASLKKKDAERNIRKVVE